MSKLLVTCCRRGALQAAAAGRRSRDARPATDSHPPDRLARGSNGEVGKGDVLVAVDGRSVHDMNLDAVRRLIVGPEGPPVALQLLRAGRRPYTVTLRRARQPSLQSTVAVGGW